MLDKILKSSKSIVSNEKWLKFYKEAKMKKTIAILLAILMLFSLFQGALRENVVKAESEEEFWATAYYCVYESEIDGVQTITQVISGTVYTLKASFLFGGYGVAMQGTGRTGPNGDYIHYTGGGGIWVHIDDPTYFTNDVRIRYTNLGITDFTGFGNLALTHPEEATYIVVSTLTGTYGRTLIPWYSIAVDPNIISPSTTATLLFKSGTTPTGATYMNFRADDTGGKIEGKRIDIYVGEGRAALNEWYQTGGNRYVVIKSVAPSVPLDIVFAIDRTGSMSNEISVVKSKAVEIINAIQSKIPDTYFGLVSFMDYPDHFTYPGYSAQYGDTSYGDVPYEVDVPLTSNISSVITATNGLTLGDGADGPQDYTRVLYESMFLNWRPSAKKVLIMFGDAPTHDLNFAGYNFGGDPGRDEVAQTSDDLDFETVVNQVKEKGIMVFAVDSGGTPQSEATFKGMSIGYTSAGGTSGRYFLLENANLIPQAVAGMIEGFQCRSYYESLGWTTITNYDSTVASGETVTVGTINVVQKGIDWLLKVLLHWSGSDLDLILIDPNGNQVVPGGNVVYSGNNSLPEYYEIRNPIPGTWIIKVYGKDVSDSEEYYGIEVFERGIGATITASAGPGGTITPSGAVSVNYGESQSFTIKADPGYFIYRILVDNAPIQFNNPMVYTYTFNNVTANHTISAEFMKIPDTTPPNLSLPTINGVNLDVPGAVITTNSGTFSFTVSAYDESGIGRMVIKVNGVVQIDKNNLDPTIYLMEGVNTVEVTVYDSAGNYTTKSFKVISDTKPPVIDVTLPETVSSPELTVKGTVIDTVSGVQSVTVNGNPVFTTLEGNFETKLTLSTGANTITIEATDKVGNKATNIFTVSYAQPQAKQSYMVVLKVGSPEITVNGISKKIDAQGSKPIIKNGRTLLPIRTLIESLGGTVEWNDKEKKVTIELNGHSMVLWIGKTDAFVDGSNAIMDVAPLIISGRTYLPLRFISEHLGASVNWDSTTQTITIYYWP
jgi:3D (Asp-Asp-Asp) domain-containing protein